MSNYDAEITALSYEHFGLDLSNEPMITLDSLTREFSFSDNFNKVIALVGDINSNVVLFKCDRIIEGHDVSQCSNKTIWWKTDRETSGKNQLTIKSVDDKNVYLIWEIPQDFTGTPCLVSAAIRFSDYDYAGKVRWSWRSLMLEGLSVEEDEEFVIPDETPMSDKFLWGDVFQGSVYLINKGDSVKLEPGYVYIVNGVSLSQVGFLYSSQWPEHPDQYMYDFFSASNNCFGWERQSAACSGVNASTSFYIKDGTTIFCPSGTETGGSPYRITFMQASESRQTSAYVDYYANTNDPMPEVYFVPYSSGSPGVVYKYKINEAFYQV